jgi:hypothetical protein
MANLKQYLSESEITDDLKGAYTKKGDRYELNALDNQHTLVIAHNEIKTKAQTRQTEIDSLTADKSNLERDLAEAKNKGVPHGYRAVTKDVAELGETAKSSGLAKDDIPNLKTKVDEYEREKTESAAKQLKTKAFQSAGVNNVDLALSLKQSDDLQFESETKDGKEIFYRVTEKDGKKEKTLFNGDYLKSADGFKDVFAQLTGGKPKNQPFPDVSGGGEGGNIFDKIREQVKTENKTEKVDLGARFGRPETV